MTDLEVAAYRFAAAYVACREADGPNVLSLAMVRDNALHDLIVRAGYRCECEPGTCPDLRVEDVLTNLL
jgi:hypothetical protein